VCCHSSAAGGAQRSSVTGCSWRLRSREHQAHCPVTYVGALDAGAWHRHLPGVGYITTRWRNKLQSWLFLVCPRVCMCVFVVLAAGLLLVVRILERQHK
jgi:hypothetical protein